jgi:SNF2 family DNA or RNA helicase
MIKLAEWRRDFAEPHRGDVEKEVFAGAAAGAKRAPVMKKTAGKKKTAREKQPAPPPPPVPAGDVPVYEVPVRLAPLDEESLSRLTTGGFSSLDEVMMLHDYTHLSVQGGFDELLCLKAIRDVEKFWYQVETVKKVLKRFRGRALLGDEVGLGKTIEAGMLIKEYLLRGMVRNVLILAPAPLVSQWREEMAAKFDLEFSSTEEGGLLKDPESFWKQRFIVASIHTAKSRKNMPLVTEHYYDLVVVDEAHHLRNKKTLSWKLVNKIQKKFILLLTATPVQNNLIELYNLITLLKPGQFKTEKVFRQEYVTRGNPTKPANRERLQDLLREVMVRNTRSAIDLKLPKRFASTLRLEPTAAERKIYDGLVDYLHGAPVRKNLSQLLLREAGSSPHALKGSLLKAGLSNGAASIVEAIDGLGQIAKAGALLDLLRKNPGEKKIVFTQFLKSMDYITGLLEENGIPHVTFRGDMSSREKNAAIAGFKEETPVLISTESGGEGRNLQFCNTLINFDLPWNPMRIEQRIGRLHRIGQKRDVFIFNLTVKDTIEDYILDILDNKINMFEMVIGEIEPILGHLDEDRGFDDVIMEVWLRSGSRTKLKESFDELGADLISAKKRYLTTQALDAEIFGEDYEV